jgi:hypothetical protein
LNYSTPTQSELTSGAQWQHSLKQTYRFMGLGRRLNIPNYTHEDVFCVATGLEMGRSSIDGILTNVERIHCFRINYGSEQAVSPNS